MMGWNFEVTILGNFMVVWWDNDSQKKYPWYSMIIHDHPLPSGYVKIAIEAMAI